MGSLGRVWGYLTGSTLRRTKQQKIDNERSRPQIPFNLVADSFSDPAQTDREDPSFCSESQASQGMVIAERTR